ncbi:MAG: Acetylornithine deacetylase/Succinyl-diaminopimelate desuccinylase [Chlorobi bacterium]|nr:Acetylornithine deacetylase/Succinyl-diaminopimelate desuccinylase [Chlorobiota bacterium]
MNETLSYIDSNGERFVEELKDFLRIPSISANSTYDPETRRAAEFVAAEAVRIGLENVRILETAGHPVVYADWLHADGKPTVLIYGHYDVQPPEPLELWTNPPFEPTVEGDSIYARGSIDDKGQVFMHLKSLESLLATTGGLPANVKIIIEGEEEVGSPNLPPFLAAHKELLACDTVMISDTTMYDYEMPGITYGLRGLAYFELHVVGPDRDLHSGMFGGAVANPINALCELIAKMKDSAGRVQLPGFYDNVVDVSPKERAELERLPYSATDFCSMINIPITVGEAGYSDLERLWARPTLDVCGIWGGYQGEGAKTVLPSKAAAKISMRLVANQDYRKVADQLRAFIQEHKPSGVSIEVIELHGGPPALTPTDSVPVRAALRALETAFGTKPFLIRSGGSIPIVADFEEQLGAPVVLMGFGLPDQNAHSPNEKMNLSNYHRGIKSSALFLQEYSRMYAAE